MSGAPANAGTNSVGVQSEGEAKGGCEGNSASPEPKRSPAALLVQSRTQQKSFLFLLEEKIRRAQIKKCEENFFAGWRASASGGGAERQFLSKKVRAFSNKGHHPSLAPGFRRRFGGVGKNVILSFLVCRNFSEC